jgi:hypothetical protein
MFLFTMHNPSLQQKVFLYGKWFHQISSESISYNEQGQVKK